ncbi:mRNA decay activator protein ZFP36L2-B [Hydra vulgaris]|uniref:mRNA decay activator protein ZFP36L2-B n=1 Tax=Hydra vulgaris TaxID=6087 RepID=A0ABM4CKQ1_HYDVU
MSTALVSAFYDINDVIQQSKQRPMLDLRQKLEDRRPNNLVIPRRHSTNSTTLISLTTQITKAQVLSPSSLSFYPMPSSPKDKFSGNVSPFRERAQSASFQEELDAQQRKRNSTNSSRYKTELCRPFEENGTCKYGDKCQFAHGFHELRGLNRHPKYKTEFCRTYHTIGFCPYGPRCHFIHNDEEKKLALTSLGRSCSISSMDSIPPSPAHDVAPSPFGNSLTPPLSPGYGGDVFLFDEPSHVAQNPLAVCGQNAMSVIPENSFPSPCSSVKINRLKSNDYIPLTSMVSGLSFQGMKPIINERYTTTPSDSGSSNPPSPVEKLRRLPVFGGLN